VSVSENYAEISRKIRNACERVQRSEEEITVIAVTKYVSVSRAKEAIEAGIVHLGENRDDELLKKIEILGDKPVWHFIGTLQSRKVKNIIDHVEYIHSLDRMSLAKEIHKRAKRKIKCFVQVNTSGEETKHGLSPIEVIPFIKQLEMYDNIQVVGLMTMAPYTNNDMIIRDCFKKLKEIQLQVQELKLEHAPCHELSMGMSNDYEIAIEEGATMIRIGSALVGERI
jgi:PLP dependent protein